MVVNRGPSFEFNDGTIASMMINKEDELVELVELVENCACRTVNDFPK
jgi:hypothetical protein